MSEKKIIDLGALIVEAMNETRSFMPHASENGVSVDTTNKPDGNTITVEGYWTAPDTGGRYYFAADVKVTPTEFMFSPPDDYYDEDEEDEGDDE